MRWTIRELKGVGVVARFIQTKQIQIGQALNAVVLPEFPELQKSVSGEQSVPVNSAAPVMLRAVSFRVLCGRSGKVAKAELSMALFVSWNC
jgi:hypothetical protein